MFLRPSHNCGNVTWRIIGPTIAGPAVLPCTAPRLHCGIARRMALQFVWGGDTAAILVSLSPTSGGAEAACRCGETGTRGKRVLILRYMEMRKGGKIAIHLSCLTKAVWPHRSWCKLKWTLEKNGFVLIQNREKQNTAPCVRHSHSLSISLLPKLSCSGFHHAVPVRSFTQVMAQVRVCFFFIYKRTPPSFTRSLPRSRTSTFHRASM